MVFSRRACAAGLVVSLLLLGVLGSDVAGLPGCRDGCKTATATAQVQLPPAPPKPPLLGIAPANGAADLNPLSRVSAQVVGGNLTNVSLVDDYGNTLAGALSPDGTSWQPTVPLKYGRTYTMQVASLGASGVPLARTTTFATASPDNLTQVYLETPGGLPIHEEMKYGIGTIIAARFDEQITDKAAAERNLVVTTNPPVQGSWYWVDDKTAHWRPAKYYAPGTTVSVAANIFGLKLGDGLYGNENAKATFTIGDAHVSIADDTTKVVSVFDNGKLVRAMPTSMGQGGYQTIAGRTFSFWTPPGVYTVIDKAESVTMDSSTYGLPVASSMGYKVKIPYATRISTDGIYLHQLNDTRWAQGNTNVSHGCLNLNGENASWFFDFSQPGDVVEVKNTGGPGLEIWQNGDWTVPWGEWLKGSALAPKP
ncbi:lipoprotein-anchoring transpeptidase ErfK/SrfK [Mycolicibacterium sp. BK556]|uniref:L,D-transpeptidase n=1 Tax=Mycobacteriaceae TaxID=1762 RepID=UPI0010612975|nr:Ig-like domain-containing protein [Mycobacterium sp. BK086]MBB3605394.1 lipoprotein-anchoring transpeptidase ErfK/SrfK [Mycolicibacterium sp. BK556]MBB3635590.1 lipoprotein-anchoring transpeptidase ErfK/SrfK [Mycolicibacterium sp. BK607]MBB3747619.1 lipoprotein-anchoring transpeptidase ErfK/SrfK [Mycolicibacterium sp. BK634]TDO08243.1 lipoprotein-anchoring transpeptidase ErfK/SrfK [Mycobacterium sp. BK086]